MLDFHPVAVSKHFIVLLIDNFKDRNCMMHLEYNFKQADAYAYNQRYIYNMRYVG